MRRKAPCGTPSGPPSGSTTTPGLPTAPPAPPATGWAAWRAAWRTKRGRAYAADVERREQAFRACYATVLQDGQAARAQTFKAISGFHESMAVAGLLVAAAGAATALAGRAPAWAWTGAGMGLAGAGSFRGSYKTFDRRFVDEVYSAFLALSRRFDRDAGTSS